MNYSVEQPEYWDKKYLNSDDKWDLKSPNPVFENIIKENKFLKPCKILILGSGKGYDAVLAAKNGYDVTAIDFSSAVIEASKKIAEIEKVEIEFLQKDIFELDEIYNEKFDAVYEYVTFCAVDPVQKENLLKKISKLLKANGVLLTVVFPIDGRQGGPPFNIDFIEFYRSASKFFKLEFSSRNINSVKPRKGKEILQIYRKL